jgi:NhaP-type Na+/H+ or K+/H+ antiporter
VRNRPSGGLVNHDEPSPAGSLFLTILGGGSAIKVVHQEFAVLAVIAFIYSVIAGRLERSLITGPMVFVVVGFLVGPFGTGWIQADVTNDDLRLLADLTLAIVLFIDAAGADVKVLGRNVRLPSRMLLVGLPGVIALGAACAWLIFEDLTLFEVAILATMLAATDAALGKGVITNPAVPAKVREGLNAESGLNDGLCVPVLLLFIALAESGGGSGGSLLALELVAREVGIGLVVGLGMTLLGVWLMRACVERGWITQVWAQIPVVGLATGCFAVAQTLHGSGYIAAFTGGILFGVMVKDRTHDLVLAAEGTAEMLALTTWLVMGTAVLGQQFDKFTFEVVLYAVLSLTIVRVVPVFAALTGAGERTDSKLFLAWFGPRGLASIVFAIIVLNSQVEHRSLMAEIVACTVFLSVFVHGLTANPLANWLASRQ